MTIGKEKPSKTFFLKEWLNGHERFDLEKMANYLNTFFVGIVEN